MSEEKIMTYEEFSKKDIIIDAETQKEIDRITENAKWNPIKCIDHLPDADSIPEDGKIIKHMEETGMTAFDVAQGYSVLLPYDIMAIVTYEYQPGHNGDETLCRHLTLVGNIHTGYYPTPGQVERILPNFGFLNSMEKAQVWVIDKEDHLIINVLEPLDGDMGKMITLEEYKKEA